MNATPFIVAAYAITFLATLLLVGWSWAAMRRLERQAADLGRKK